MNKEDEIHMRAEELNKEYVEYFEQKCKEGVPIESLTIDTINQFVEQGRFLPIAPNDFMPQGIILDVFTMSVIQKVYVNLGKENQEKFNHVLQTPALFMNLTDKMWRWFK